MIPFNAPPVVGTELEYMQAAMGSGKLCGDGGFTRRCQQWMEQHFACPKVLLTPSCTASLEMAAILLDIQPDDEVIMPSYTFVSTANAFVLRRLHYRNWGWNLALGLLGIVLGFLILANPAIGALGATVWVAIALVVLGVALMVLGLRLRSASAHAA